MRISSGMIFDAGLNSMNTLTDSLLHTQQQVSSGRRVLTPADDPVAAASALDVTQASNINAQYALNQNNATSALGLEATQLSSAGNLLTQAKQLAVQAGNATLNSSDRTTIATQLRAIFDQMLGIANAQDSSGQYLFAGNKGSTQAFSGTVEGGVSYNGDNGQRKLQLSASQQLAVSDSGNAVFQNIAAGNGYFATANGSGNSGSGVIDVGSVSDPAKWIASNKGNTQVKFWVDTTGSNGPPNTTYYDLVDSGGNSLYTGTASTQGGGTNTYTHVYTGGQPIPLSQTAAPAFDYGASVTITGAPATNDSFSISPGKTQSVFATLSNLILSLESASTATPAGSAKLSNDVSSALTNIDQADSNILSVQAAIGSRQNEVTSLASVNSSLNLQYQQSLSGLQDVNYTQAVSDLTRLQTQLQAAQKSFAMVSQLSLFTYIP
ncbi:MAG TPA: flagellar hook-associated protein FlgL [Rhodocyclaceae bacterium]|nr:flagellar hook-associated protein FlgL [Rhodocyclaceae bacterium]